MNFLKNWFVQILCISLASSPCFGGIPNPSPCRIDTTISLLKSWLIHVIAIRVLSYPCLGCQPVASPCRLDTTISRASITGLNAECTARVGVSAPLGSVAETCEIPPGESFTIADNACDIGALTNQPILLNNNVVNPSNPLSLTCSGDGQLRAVEGTNELEKDVNQADCAANTCNVENQISKAFISGNLGVCNGVPNSNPTAENCVIPSGASFTVNQSACGTGQAVLLNGALSTPTSEISFLCTNGVLSSSGGITNADDINTIGCVVGTTCNLENQISKAFISGNLGVCTGVPNSSPASENCVIPSGASFTVNQNACGTGQAVLLNGALSTPTSDISFLCTNGVLSSSGGITNAGDINTIGCAQCNFQLYSDPLEGVLMDALINREIICTPDQSLPDRVACSLANPCTCVMQDGVTARVVSAQCPGSPPPDGPQLMRFHAALIPTGSCLSAELPQSPQAGVLSCSMDVLSLMVPGVVTQFAPIDEVGCTTASCPAP